MTTNAAAGQGRSRQDKSGHVPGDPVNALITTAILGQTNPCYCLAVHFISETLQDSDVR